MKDFLKNPIFGAIGEMAKAATKEKGEIAERILMLGCAGLSAEAAERKLYGAPIRFHPEFDPRIKVDAKGFATLRGYEAHRRKWESLGAMIYAAAAENEDDNIAGFLAEVKRIGEAWEEEDEGGAILQAMRQARTPEEIRAEKAQLTKAIENIEAIRFYLENAKGLAAFISRNSEKKGELMEAMEQLDTGPALDLLKQLQK
ncbi:MAG: hypothetical protein CMN78_05535 [Spirochaetales bacterium]|nr:hypothetical protein [Spirochaetales bacterium]